MESNFLKIGSYVRWRHPENGFWVYGRIMGIPPVNLRGIYEWEVECVYERDKKYFPLRDHGKRTLYFDERYFEFYSNSFPFHKKNDEASEYEFAGHNRKVSVYVDGQDIKIMVETLHDIDDVTEAIERLQDIKAEMERV